MDDLQALHRAILDQPADDTVRLAFADRLEETGKAANVARAEFIRLQIARHNYTGDTLIAQVAESLRKEEPILKKWVARWLPKCLRPGYPGLRLEGSAVWIDHVHGYATFERGFVQRLGFEINTTSQQAYNEDLARIARTCQNVFASTPLAGISVSFEMPSGWDFPTFHAEIGPYHLNTLVEPPRPFWRVMWDMATYENASHDMVATPLMASSRANLGCQLAFWLKDALRLPSAEAIRLADQQREEAGAAVWPTEVEIAEYEERVRRDLDPVPPFPVPPATAEEMDLWDSLRNDVDWHR